MLQSEKPIIRRVESANNGHFYLDSNDRQVTGVTTILKCLPKEALQVWRLRKAVDLALKGEKALKDKPNGVSPTTWLIAAGEREGLTAAALGTGVHTFCESFMLGNDPNIDDYNEKERYHINCFLQFVRDFEPKPVLVEKVVVHIDPKTNIPLFAGTIDMMAELKDGLIWLIDWKSSSSQPRSSHALQAAFYRYATHWLDVETGELHTMPSCDRAAVVLLNGGKCETACYRAFELDASPVVFSVCKSLLRIHNFSQIENRVILGELE